MKVYLVIVADSYDGDEVEGVHRGVGGARRQLRDLAAEREFSVEDIARPVDITANGGDWQIRIEEWELR